MSVKPVHKCHNQIPAEIKKKKGRVSQMKPNAELTEILNHFRPCHLEETIKGNKSARGGKKCMKKY